MRQASQLYITQRDSCAQRKEIDSAEITYGPQK